MSSHLVGESVGEHVPGIKRDIGGCQDKAIINGGGGIDAMSLPFLHILADLLVVVIGRRAIIFESGITAALVVGLATEIDESGFNICVNEELCLYLQSHRRPLWVTSVRRQPARAAGFL